MLAVTFPVVPMTMPTYMASCFRSALAGLGQQAPLSFGAASRLLEKYHLFQNSGTCDQAYPTGIVITLHEQLTKLFTERRPDIKLMALSVILCGRIEFYHPWQAFKFFLSFGFNSSNPQIQCLVFNTEIFIKTDGGLIWKNSRTPIIAIPSPVLRPAPANPLLGPSVITARAPFNPPSAPSGLLTPPPELVEPVEDEIKAVIKKLSSNSRAKYKKLINSSPAQIRAAIDEVCTSYERILPGQPTFSALEKFCQPLPPSSTRIRELFAIVEYAILTKRADIFD